MLCRCVCDLVTPGWASIGPVHLFLQALGTFLSCTFVIFPLALLFFRAALLLGQQTLLLVLLSLPESLADDIVFLLRHLLCTIGGSGR